MPPIEDMLIKRGKEVVEEQSQTEIASNIRVWLRGSGHKIKKERKEDNN